MQLQSTTYILPKNLWSSSHPGTQQYIFPLVHEVRFLYHIHLTVWHLKGAYQMHWGLLSCRSRKMLPEQFHRKLIPMLLVGKRRFVGQWNCSNQVSLCFLEHTVTSIMVSESTVTEPCNWCCRVRKFSSEIGAHRTNVSKITYNTQEKIAIVTVQSMRRFGDYVLCITVVRFQVSPIWYRVIIGL